MSAALRGLDLVDLEVGEIKLVERLGVRVRDQDWNTIPATFAATRLEAGSDGFAFSLHGRHRSGELDFEWQGTVSAESDGGVLYEMDGRARIGFPYGRIGLCILHPPASAAGRRFRALTPNGPIAGRLPELVAPQPVVDGVVFPLVPAFTRLEIDVMPDLTLVLELEGDLFEIEDQRNWTDGSFKTYSTPVGLPTPLHASPGQTIRQRVLVQTIGPGAARPRRRATPLGRIEIRIGAELGERVPPIGVGVDSDRFELDSHELALLRALALAHVRADLHLGCHDQRPGVGRVGRLAAALGTTIELALVLPEEEATAHRALDELAPAIALLPLARVLVFHAADWVTAPRWLELARAALGPSFALPIVGGTNFHFAELNRDRPDCAALDGLAYSITPQVHDVDDPALMQSLVGQSATIRTARTFASGRPVHVTPVTLKARDNAYAASPVPGGPLPQADERQAALLAAAWTVGSVKQLSEGGAASITYFELTGSRGVIARADGSAPTYHCTARPGEAFPVYHVLRDVCAWRDRELFACTSSDPLEAEAVAVRVDGALHGLVANLTPQTRDIVLGGLGGGEAMVRVIDDASARPARVRPALFATRAKAVGLSGGSLTLRLTPYATAHVVARPG